MEICLCMCMRTLSPATLQMSSQSSAMWQSSLVWYFYGSCRWQTGRAEPGRASERNVSAEGNGKDINGTVCNFPKSSNSNNNNRNKNNNNILLMRLLILCVAVIVVVVVTLFVMQKCLDACSGMLSFAPASFLFTFYIFTLLFPLWLHIHIYIFIWIILTYSYINMFKCIKSLKYSQIRLPSRIYLLTYSLSWYVWVYVCLWNYVAYFKALNIDVA